MKLSAVIATLEGCSFDALNDPRFIEQVLRDSVAAGHFTMLHHYVHAFAPQGVTGVAVLSESHIAVHTWPEEGLLFVDLATCSGAQAARAAFAAICALVPHVRVRRRLLRCDSDARSALDAEAVRRPSSVTRQVRRQLAGVAKRRVVKRAASTR